MVICAVPDKPLVSIGVPVRNGGDLLYDALDELVKQSFSDIEIIISDNCSSDQTAEICRSFSDSRIRYFRQDTPLTAPENFHFCLGPARAEYFMFAAHDDRHSPDFVESLYNTAIANPGCSLVFPDLVIFSDHGNFKLAPQRYDFSSRKTDPFLKKARRALEKPYHFYGLYPKSLLDEWDWPPVDIGADKIFLAYAAMRGDFIKSPNGVFYYFSPLKPKDENYYSIALNYKKVGPFPKTRRVWYVAHAACNAEKRDGRHHFFFYNFLRLYIPTVLWPHLRRLAYRLAPDIVRRGWRAVKIRLQRNAS